MTDQSGGAICHTEPAEANARGIGNSSWHVGLDDPSRLPGICVPTDTTSAEEGDRILSYPIPERVHQERYTRKYDEFIVDDSKETSNFSDENQTLRQQMNLLKVQAQTAEQKVIELEQELFRTKEVAVQAEKTTATALSNILSKLREDAEQSRTKLALAEMQAQRSKKLISHLQKKLEELLAREQSKSNGHERHSKAPPFSHRVSAFLFNRKNQSSDSIRKRTTEERFWTRLWRGHSSVVGYTENNKELVEPLGCKHDNNTVEHQQKSVKRNVVIRFFLFLKCFILSMIALVWNNIIFVMRCCRCQKISSL